MAQSKNIRNILRDYCKEKGIKRIQLAKNSLNYDQKISYFLSGTGGIFGHQLVRILLSLGYKIVGPDGNIVLGENPEKEIRENFEDK